MKSCKSDKVDVIVYFMIENKQRTKLSAENAMNSAREHSEP